MSLLVPLSKSLFSPGKGIIAMDDRPESMNKRLEFFNIATTLKMRTLAREIVATTPHLSEYVSGIIFNKETFNQKTDADESFQEILQSEGILIGIKVDEGLTPFKNTEEKVTLGLDTLELRLKTYKKQGAVFTKWRAVFSMLDYLPTTECIEANCALMSSFISISQKSGFVP